MQRRAGIATVTAAFLLAAHCMTASLPVNHAWSAPVELRIGNATISHNVKSLRDMKFNNIVRQTQDFSCGAAALATIMVHYFGIPTRETDILEAVFLNADKATVKRIRERGISLLDLKHYAEANGLVGEGYRMKPKQLETLDRPAIALVDLNGYSHFVVIRGVERGRIYLADPARGHWFRNLDEFAPMWNGILLAFKRSDGQKVAAHDLEIKPFWPQGASDLLPTDLLEMQFAHRIANEF